VYAGSHRDCRPCPLREQCQWEGHETRKPRQVSVLLHPLPVGPAPLLWRDWSRRVHRRACMQLVRDQRIEISLSPSAASPPTTEVILSREQRAHSRLSWAERLARNGRVPTADQVTIKLFGIPAGFATSLGLATVSHGLANRCIRSSRTSWLLRRSHIPSFPRWFSLLPLCCPFCSPSPLVWPDLPDLPSGSAWLSLTDQR
jgi:hypothetical protein